MGIVCFSLRGWLGLSLRYLPQELLDSPLTTARSKCPEENPKPRRRSVVAPSFAMMHPCFIHALPLLVLVDTIRASSLAALSKSFEESIAIVQKSRPMTKGPQGPGSPEGKQATCSRWLSAYGISCYCTLFALVLHVPASWPILVLPTHVIC
ncbi:hypothetical protein B0T10DRAFT_285177 [Thelonectria olida]|uniref:Uncharacterized protein n=1 Tax=Thelonectria olida TaxID=1576542 RepID=A0A9P8W6U0_9HYPO|nr:hypothetical protein B0T10DRAFT_285177 [Thelonectria olida]